VLVKHAILARTNIAQGRSKTVGKVLASEGDSQPKLWAKLHSLGQPCRIHRVQAVTPPSTTPQVLQPSCQDVQPSGGPVSSTGRLTTSAPQVP